MGFVPATNYPIYAMAKTLGLQVMAHGGVGCNLNASVYRQDSRVCGSAKV